MSSWEDRRLHDVAELLKWLLARGATNGIEVTREDMAAAIGVPVTRIDVLVRWLRENPNLGFAITMQRGSVPLVIVSTPKDKINGRSLLAERRIAYDVVLTHYWQIARAVASEFVHWKNKEATAVTPEEKRLSQKTRAEHRNQLVMIQQAMQPQKRPAEADLAAFIENVLGA